MAELDIGELEEKMKGITLSDSVDLLMRIVSLEQAPAFIMGFCASSDERFSQVMDYIAGRLQIKNDDVMRLDLKSLPYITSQNHIDYLKNNISRFNALPGDAALVAIDGFECMPSFNHRTIDNLREAHDFTQDVVQYRKSRFSGLNKKVVVVTHLGHSLGDEIYSFALKSINQTDTRFVSFKYELD